PPATPAPAAAPAADSAPQEAPSDQKDIIVTGARATQRNSIDLKRNSSVIVDGIVNDEIGAQPDNSVGDTLERIAGVSADRFKGNANELSVRGLGPTLSFATFNGREVSSAGGDRSVAFQQFPSELVNVVLVYKSQEADFLEGGIGGIIELRSLKPLDYGKRRFQAEIRGDYSAKDGSIIGRTGIGYRANASFVDQFRTGIGEIGFSIGYQHQDTTAPEDYYTGNSTFSPCTTSALNGTLTTGNTAALNAAGANQTCSNATKPRTGIGETIGDTYFATSSRSWRQNSTKELRDAVIGTLEWRPAPNLDIAIDGQYSKRNSTENRNTFAIAEASRGITPILIGDGTNGYSKGALIKYSGNSNLEDQLERRERDEQYIGGGLTIGWHNDHFSLTGDGSYSGSHRTETQKATRMRSNTRVGYTLDYGDDVVPSVTFDNFDITDPDNFDANSATSVYARNRFVTDRWDKIWAVRLDGEYKLDQGFFTSIKIGARYSDHARTLDNNRNTDLNTIVPYGGMTVAQIINKANADCRTPFPQSAFFTTTSTNVTRWASFDNDCLFRTFTGSDNALPYPGESRDPSDINLRERIKAAYAMTNFRGQLGSTPFSGNAGVRYVRTDITSTGYRSPILISVDPNADSYTVVADPTGTITSNTQRSHYQYWLPSANIAFDLTSKTKLRFALYRALSRAPIESFGSGISFTPVTTGQTCTTNPCNSFRIVSATGNPALKPMRAWNADASLEFYFSKDSMLSIAGYYKWLRGAVISATTTIPETVDARVQILGGTTSTQQIVLNPVAPANDQDSRHLYGLEVTFSHAFSYLPSPLDGFGVTGSYNIAWANFESPDPSALAPYTDPANLNGFSHQVANGTIYWEKGGFSIRASYRYRSYYFKPNSSTNRSVQSAGYLNLSAEYDLTKNIALKLQAQNVTNTKDVFFKGVYDNIAEVSESGPVYYAGVRVRF
ncbi:MAG: TonB-dependent receptor, partial [Sphingomonas sp.]|uniref:TonB-dependent receptor n=1 Tax=Sphingomonas sp. TaxID=28214 RepID=UPI003F8044FD